MDLLLATDFSLKLPEIMYHRLSHFRHLTHIPRSNLHESNETWFPSSARRLDVLIAWRIDVHRIKTDYNRSAGEWSIYLD